jgi:hypothetical protein
MMALRNASATFKCDLCGYKRVAVPVAARPETEFDKRIFSIVIIIKYFAFDVVVNIADGMYRIFSRYHIRFSASS